MDQTVAAGFQPALSYKMKADHGFMTVYYELDPLMRLADGADRVELHHTAFDDACGSATTSARRSATRFEAIPGCERVALCAAGGLSHFIGEPRVGDIDEEFDRWFVEQLEKPDLARTARHAQRRTDAGGQRHRRGSRLGGRRRRDARSSGTTLSYEPIYEWINGMGVVMYDADTPPARGVRVSWTRGRIGARPSDGSTAPSDGMAARRSDGSTPRLTAARTE